MTPPAKIGYYRWVICALLFFATTINYVDRQVIGILKTTLQGEFGWNEIDYSNIVFAFQTRVCDRADAGRPADGQGRDQGRLRHRAHRVEPGGGGLRRGHDVWPGGRQPAGDRGVRRDAVGGRLHGGAFALGLGEGGNFPAAIKSVAEWFPKRERALATGIFNSGTNVGAVVTPLVVPWITVRYGWYWAFVITGALGFLWLIAWWLMYDTPERHPRVTPAELAHINSDPPEPRRRCPGPACSRTAKPGRSRSASS